MESVSDGDSDKILVIEIIMKIGILTLPLNTNYGGILQAYALQTVIERIGHEVKVIDVSGKAKLKWYKAPFVICRRILSQFTSHPTPILFEHQLNKERKTSELNTRPFIKQNIHTYIARQLDDIKEGVFDAIIVGSDQIWRPKYVCYMSKKNALENAYLQFAKDWHIKRIAYAASFGVEDWEYTQEETNNCMELIKLFDALSVREESAVGLCKRELKADAIHVLDPTMLLDKKDYTALFFKKQTPPSSGKLMVYVLDKSPKITNVIKHIEDNYHLSPFYTSADTKNKNIPLSQRIQPPVENWLRGFYDAELVITDSFHACVFSILFGKPFIVFGNDSRGMARFQSLLRMFDLEYRLWSEQTDLERCLKPISNQTYEKLEEWRIKSLSFLKNGLA